MIIGWRKLLVMDTVLFAVYQAIVRQGQQRDLLIGPVPKRLRTRCYRVHREIEKRLRQPNKNWLAAECFTTVLAGGEYPIAALADLRFTLLPYSADQTNREIGWLFVRHRRKTELPLLTIRVDLSQGV